MAKRVSLFYIDQFSDKVYHMELIECKRDGKVAGWQVYCRYGRRGNANRTASYPPTGPVVHSIADELFERLLKQKLNKGYQIAK